MGEWRRFGVAIFFARLLPAVTSSGGDAPPARPIRAIT